MNGKVSIIVPAYNSAKYIVETLRSLVNQSYKDTEIIVVNDGSKDETSLVVKSFFKGDDADWKLVEKSNGGQASARNAGVKAANGDYLIFIDSDDFISPNYIERMLGAVTKYDADFSGCAYQRVGDDNLDKEPEYDNGDKAFPSEELKMKYLHRRIQLIAPAVLIKRSIFSKISFDEKCPYDEDGLFVWALLFNSSKGVYCDTPMYNYRVRKGSIMHTLTPQSCMASIECYRRACEDFSVIENDSDVLALIFPNYVISSMHVLAKCVDFKQFKSAYKAISTQGMKHLILDKDLKLSLFALLYQISPRLFHFVSVHFI